MDTKDIKDPDVREAAEEMEREKAPEVTPPTEPVKEPVQEPEPPKEPEKVPETAPEPIPERPSVEKGEPVWKQKEREKDWRKQTEDEIKSLRESVATKEDLAELKSLLTDLGKAKTPAATQEATDDIKEFAESKGLDPEIIRGIVEVAEKRVKPTQNAEVEEALKFYKEQKEQTQQAEETRKVKEYWDNKFEEDFSKLPDDAKAAKEELKKLFYDPRYAGAGKTPYELSHIWLIEKENLVAPKKKSAESGGNQATETLILDTENKDEMARKLLENEKKLSPQQQEEVMEHLFTRSSTLQKKNNTLSP